MEMEKRKKKFYQVQPYLKVGQQKNPKERLIQILKFKIQKKLIILHQASKNAWLSEGESSSFEDETEKRETCIICNSPWVESKIGEGWIQCSGCQEWADEAYSNVEEVDDIFYRIFLLL